MEQKTNTSKSKREKTKSKQPHTKSSTSYILTTTAQSVTQSTANTKTERQIIDLKAEEMRKVARYIAIAAAEEKFQHTTTILFATENLTTEQANSTLREIGDAVNILVQHSALNKKIFYLVKAAALAFHVNNFVYATTLVKQLQTLISNNQQNIIIVQLTPLPLMR
jgi:hypothetical protein